MGAEGHALKPMLKTACLTVRFFKNDPAIRQPLTGGNHDAVFANHYPEQITGKGQIAEIPGMTLDSHKTLGLVLFDDARILLGELFVICRAIDIHRSRWRVAGQTDTTNTRRRTQAFDVR